MAHDVFRKSSGKMDRKSTHPKREWFIGLFIFVVILSTGGFFTAENYRYYSTLENAIENTAKPSKKYNEKDASTALKIFEEREARFRVLTSANLISPPVVSDIASSTEDNLLDFHGEGSAASSSGAVASSTEHVVVDPDNEHTAVSTELIESEN